MAVTTGLTIVGIGAVLWFLLAVFLIVGLSETPGGGMFFSPRTRTFLMTSWRKPIILAIVFPFSTLLSLVSFIERLVNRIKGTCHC
mgnify:FL=1